MLFKKKNVENEEWLKKAEEKEAMLLNMVQDSGLALSLEENRKFYFFHNTSRPEF